jgi:heterodisulfide reductase subunit A
MEVELEALEKDFKKISRQVKQLEEKQGKSSAQVIEEVRSGTASDELRAWAAQAEQASGMESRIEAMKKTLAAARQATKLAFIQCVGSRDFRFNRFCSSFCCMHSVKEAMIAYEHNSEVASTIFCMDLRAVGRGFEEYKLRGGKQSNVTYLRGRVAEITQDEANNPIVWYESTTNQKAQSETFDMVILATACVPANGTRELADLFGVELDLNGFFKTDPLVPLDSTREGIFTCGCAQGPMDIPESVAQASSAAARAAEIVSPALRVAVAGS